MTPLSEDARVTLIAAALPASLTAPRVWGWEDRKEIVAEVLKAAEVIDAAAAAGTLGELS